MLLETDWECCSSKKHYKVRKNIGPRVRLPGFKFLHNSCVTLGRVLSFSFFSFLLCKMDITSISTVCVIVWKKRGPVRNGVLSKMSRA